MLERFYTLFESMYLYIKDFLKFLAELEEGCFIQSVPRHTARPELSH